MKVICCLSRKGGVGKSLTARSLAVAALFDNERTAVLDADPQGSILSWVERREPPAPRVFPLEGTIAATLSAIRKGKPDYVFIDTPPSVHPVIDMAVQAADLALIITGPYPEDLAAIGSSVQVVKSRKKRAVIILNRTPIRSSALHSHGVPWASSRCRFARPQLFSASPIHMQPARAAQLRNGSPRATLRMKSRKFGNG
ncbi:MAG: AAA family ATPase [Rhodopila sp.]